MEEDKTKETLRCDECRSKLPLGGDVVKVERAVLGPRGVIPLGEAVTFCSEECVSRFFDQDPGADLPEVHRRVP